jgi:hypothetical protein
LLESIPGSAADEWAIIEYDAAKQVVVTWKANGAQTVLSLDMNTGNWLQHDRREADLSGDIPNDLPEVPLAPDSAKPADPVLAFARGLNRIYILGGGKECFLSAQTNQARPIWRSEFHNPLLNGQSARVLHELSNRRLPKNVLAGNWTVEETGDHKQVVVSWTGMGVCVTLRFDAAGGKLISDEFQKVENSNPATR